MSRQTRQNALIGTSSARFIEYLQVGTEKVIIDVRPMHMKSDDTNANKWMDPLHWNELYAILLECVNDHIKSTEKYYEEQKAQTPLLKVMYKFKPFKKGFQEILQPYNYHTKYPRMALDDAEESPAVQPYFNMVVALVFPGESSVVGFDDLPTYFQTKSKNAQDNLPKRSLSLPSRSKSREEKIKNLFGSYEPDSKQNFVCPDSAAKTETDFKSEDESGSVLSDIPDHVFDFEPEEPSCYENENCEGDSPVWRVIEPESPIVPAHVAASPPEPCLPNSQFQDSPDMFAEYNSAEGSCKNQRSTGVGGSSSSSNKTCAQLKLPEGSTVLKREMSPAGQFPEKRNWRKKLRRMVVPSSSAEERSVGSQRDQVSPTKSERDVSDCDDRGNSFDNSPSSLSRKPYDSLHETNRNVKAVETNVESEAARVNGIPPPSNEDKRPNLLHGLPWEQDTDDETMMECPGKSCESTLVESPTVRDMPSKFPQWSAPSSSESDSDKVLQSSGSKRHKRKRRFSKHELERRRKGSPPSVSDSLQWLLSDASKQSLADGELNVRSSGSAEGNQLDSSPLSRLRKRNLFGSEEETTPSKNSPCSEASTKTACNVDTATSGTSPKKKTCDNKRNDKQSDSSNTLSDSSKRDDKQPEASKRNEKQTEASKRNEKQPKAPRRGVRSSPRKVSPVCYGEQGDGKLNAEPSEGATKRISPRKKTQLVREKKEAPGGVQKRGRGRPRKGSDAQKRVLKRLSLGSAGQKGSQITDYFGAGNKKSPSAKSPTEPVKSPKANEASTSSLTSKALLLAEERMEAMCKDLLLSDDDTGSSDGQESKFVSFHDRGPRAKEMAAEKARYVGVIKNLSLDEITRTFNENCVTYHGIFKGRVRCVRHELYKMGEEQRLGLRYSTSTNPFTEVQLSHMMDLLTKKFCKDNPLHFTDYLWKVLIPELANHVFMAQFDLDYDQSLAKIRDLYKFSYSDSD